MTERETRDLAQRAEALYFQRWKNDLERDQRDKFVAIEPDSEQYFVGKTVSDACAKASQAHPGRLTHVIRVGHPAALHVGNAFHDR